ncbi:MAG: outer membrane beta-barrel protein [Pseudobdellovibrionaceae bacterium]
MRNFIFSFLIIFSGPLALALQTELGINYNYKKSAFDGDNNTEQQSATGSISFYFWEKVALELSYTNGLYVKKEKQPTTDAKLRTTTQYTDVYGMDLIYILSDRKAIFQPYIKGGVAQVRVKQVVQDDGANPWDLTYQGLSPSYGIGFKFFLTEAFALRASYDGIQTPTNNDTKINDITGRVGVSWIF